MQSNNSWILFNLWLPTFGRRKKYWLSNVDTYVPWAQNILQFKRNNPYKRDEKIVDFRKTYAEEKTDLDNKQFNYRLTNKILQHELQKLLKNAKLYF